MNIKVQKTLSHDLTIGKAMRNITNEAKEHPVLPSGLHSSQIKLFSTMLILIYINTPIKSIHQGETVWHRLDKRKQFTPAIKTIDLAEAVWHRLDRREQSHPEICQY